MEGDAHNLQVCTVSFVLRSHNKLYNSYIIIIIIFINHLDNLDIIDSAVYNLKCMCMYSAQFLILFNPIITLLTSLSLKFPCVIHYLAQKCTINFKIL